MTSILITGATSGIGLALAKLAADKGYGVIACGRNRAVLNELANHQNIEILQFDITDETATQEALANLSPDISVLNAGVCEYVDINQIEPKMFERVFAANFFGVVNSVAALVPNLKPGSQLVLVDSLARLLPFTRSQAYGASKAALHYFCKSLEVDLSTKQILVQSVSPGFVETPLTNKNDFDMPMRIPVEDAVKEMLVGIEKRSKSIYFPTLFSLILRTLSHLPNRAKVALSQRMKSSINNQESI